ncbi:MULTISPECIES: hypothetical protein [unclassified Bartonella]|uniref:hypothetical protein n=1 Tax=unclassified Bartonella TaxID=2645622 RepID=UPI0021C8BD4F|nr:MULTISPECIES: hypothetical protein [unclassified Bartonella]UXN02923.1 hypothetical protein N6B01_10665 [Bartonella sp. HY406]UXN05886.1 hypothetical protein N6A79_11395 [Bartonella sp. HY761]
MKIKRGILFILGLIIVPTLSFAQNAPKGDDTSFALIREENAKEVATYPLNEDFLSRMEKVRTEFQALPLESNPPGTGDDDTSIDGMTQAISGRPELMTLLRKYSISAHDYVVGSMALSAALSAASAQGEEQFFDESLSVSENNLNFGRRYIDRIRAVLAD